MKFCPTCGMQLEDDAAFCAGCGTNMAAAAATPEPEAAPAPQPEPAPAPQPVPAPAPAPAPAVEATPEWDHTAEFSAQEISEGKVYAMLCYLLGPIGIIIALLAGKENGFIQFHVREAVKLTVAEILCGIVTAVLCWTVIVAIAGAIFEVILFVLCIIAFFQICSGKAKEPAIIRSMKFLK